MKLGILVESEEGLDWEAWRATFRAAERLGFESVWISDHLASPWEPRRHGLEPWSALAVAAAETSRIVVGPLVSPITFRRPAIVARMAESLDQLSHGRFVLGLGLGWNADEHAAAGIRFPSVAERSRLLEEGIQRIRRDLGERRVPLLIGGRGIRSTLPIVARYADEWNVTTSSASEFQASATELEGMCLAIGRDPRRIRRSAAMGFLIGRDPGDLIARCKRLRNIVPPLARSDDTLGAAMGMGWLVGAPDQIVKGLTSLAEVGVERAILGHYDLSDTAALELVAEAVLPAVA